MTIVEETLSDVLCSDLDLSIKERVRKEPYVFVKGLTKKVRNGYAPF